MAKKKANATAFEVSVMLDAGTDLRETADGYMVCSPRISRTGVQVYQGAEVGRPDLKEVRVYRPESEVFSQDSIASLAHKPVTIEHPDEPVTARNWKDVAVGHIGGDVLRDGEFVRVPLVLMDHAAIEAVRGGKSQLSVGYTAVLQWADGVTPSGEAYDVTQTSIRANHVAITHTARGGNKLRMGDRKQEKPMATKTITVDGIPVELEDRDGTLIERSLSKLKSELAAANTALATAKTTSQNDMATAKTETANATALVQTKDAEIATLKKQLTDAVMTPEKIDKMVSDRAQTMTRARSLIGDALVVDGRSDADIRRQVVNATMGDGAKGWNDEMITASFNTLAVKVADQDNGTGLQHVVNVLRNNDTGGGDPLKKAYDQYDIDLSNRWKTAGMRTPV